MPLSPIAQYCLRKLLRQSIDNLESLLMPKSNGSRVNDVNLERILNSLTTASSLEVYQLEELELLIKLYQQLEQNRADANHIAAIKRRILQVLGLQATAMFSAKLPPIVQESSIELFRFFYQEQVQEGMRYEHTLYGAIHTFPLAYRLQAYQIAWALFDAKAPLILTLSPTRFMVWVNIQSPAYAILLRQDTKLLKSVLALNTVLRKSQAVFMNHDSRQSPLQKVFEQIAKIDR